jgi:hypothetical protein
MSLKMSFEVLKNLDVPKSDLCKAEHLLKANKARIVKDLDEFGNDKNYYPLGIEYEKNLENMFEKI